PAPATALTCPLALHDALPILDSVHVGGLGGTYGGNPVACAAALGAIETMEAEDLAGWARRIGEIMVPRLRKLAGTYPVIADVRGDRKSTRLNSSHQITSYAVF